MKVGIITLAVDVAALVQRAEALGFDSFWLPEHIATPVHIAPKTTTYRLHLEPDGTPQPLYRVGNIADPFIGLARASAVTQTMKLGTGICLIPEHHPILLAKQVKLPAHRAGLLTGRWAPPTIARSDPTCPQKEDIF
jgi:alkanesulfonate monooxygenase SsuD/methylene tetrahydromethanopterin reductase-like flavin-dependent oxidoreductase (luciferase family)